MNGCEIELIHDSVHTTISNSPVTSTITPASGTSTQHVTLIPSTILSTSVSTICTQCVAPPTSMTAASASKSKVASPSELATSKQASSFLAKGFSNSTAEVSAVASILFHGYNQPPSIIAHPTSIANNTASANSTASPTNLTQTTTNTPQGLFTMPPASANNTANPTGLTNTTTYTPQGLFTMPPASAVSAIDKSMSLSASAAVVAQTLTSRLTMTPTSTMTALNEEASSIDGSSSRKVTTKAATTKTATTTGVVPFHGAASRAFAASPIALVLALVVLIFS